MSISTGENMKIGKEVEGRFIGVDSLFVSAKDIKERREIVLSHMEKFKLTQLYISDHENELLLEELDRDLWQRSFIITVERTKLFEIPPTNIHVLLTIDSESFWFLKESDGIKFSKDLFVRYAHKECMPKTVPSDFSADVEIADEE